MGVVPKSINPNAFPQADLEAILGANSACG
jgi:hypothetical protein